jgi:hypothetical protein
MRFRGSLLGGSAKLLGGNVELPNTESPLFRKIPGKDISKVVTSTPFFMIVLLVWVATLIGAIWVTSNNVNPEQIALWFLWAIFIALTVAVLLIMLPRFTLAFGDGGLAAYQVLGGREDVFRLSAGTSMTDSFASNVASTVGSAVSNMMPTMTVGSDVARVDALVGL